MEYAFLMRAHRLANAQLNVHAIYERMQYNQHPI